MDRKMAYRGWIIRLVLGFILGACLTPGLVWLGQTVFISESPGPVTPALIQTVGSVAGAVAVQSVLGGILGSVLSLATLPFAEDGRKLLLQSLLHFCATGAALAALLWGACWVERPTAAAVWLAVLAGVYLLIWLGRWTGWYMEVVWIRTRLGLTAKPSPLKIRESLPYVLFAGLLCLVIPAALVWVDRTVVVDAPVFSGLLYPLILLPITAFFTGLALGKRQGVCLLFPVACFLFYLPVIFLWMNDSALFHAWMAAVPALLGNLIGWAYDRRRRKRDRRGA